MKKILAIVAAVGFLCSCEQIQGMMNPKEDKPAESTSSNTNSSDSSSNSSSGYKYDPTTLKHSVQSNIKYYVDPSYAAVGSSATQEGSAGATKMSNTIAVVGEMDGKKIVELTGTSYMDHVNKKPAVIALLVDNTGKVHKAWGGLVGEVGVELPVPAERKMEGKAQKTDTKIEDLSPVTHCTIKGEGKKYTTNGVSSSMWKNTAFPFFGGVIQTESKGYKMVLTKHSKSGAKAQLKLK